MNLRIGVAGRTISRVVRERRRGRAAGSLASGRRSVTRDEGVREREAVREATAAVRDGVGIAVETPGVADGIVYEDVDGLA